MSKILNLVEYDLVLSTSFENNFGVSGHLYELIDYYYISKLNGINTLIVLTDGTTIDIFKKAVIEKYNFTLEELSDIFKNTIECFKPKIIRTNNICIVDGSPTFGGCSIIVENMFLLRCHCKDYSYFKNQNSIKKAYLLQDYGLYDEREKDLPIESIDYVKKILWKKYHYPKETNTKTALLYLTTNCRELSLDAVNETMKKYPYEKYLIVTNNTEKYKSIESPSVLVEKAPINNLFEKFDTYIYTPTKGKTDCSPRFIVECAVFDKKIIYDIEYIAAGIERRKEAIEKNLTSLHLNDDDDFVKIIKEKANL